MRTLGIGNRLAVGRAATSSGVTGISVKSYNFDGTSYLTSTYDPSTIGTGDISVSMWVKVPYLPGSTEYIWCLGNDDLSDTLALRIISDKIQLFGQVGATGGVSLSAANTLLNDFWHHVVVTRTGTTVELFINGTSQGSSINAEWAADLSGGETWFAYQGGAASFTGDIANIEIRSGVLTDSEIYNYFRSNTAYTTGTAQDVPITNNGATASNSVIPLAWSNNHSFYFDGINDYIRVADNFLTSYGSDTTGSISAWVKCTDVSAANFPIFTCHNNGITKYLRFMQYEGRLWAGLWDGAWDWILDTDNSDITVDTWHHVALVQDGVEPVLYVDGVATDQAFNISTNKTTWLSSAAFTKTDIGAFQTASQYFEGFIDEVRYYSGTALSSGQVAAIYNAATPQDFSTPAPDYNLHEGTGADWSGNNNLATLQSGATATSDVPVLTIPDWVLEHSLDFNGTDQEGVIPDDNALSFTNGSNDLPFSIGFWIKIHSADGCRIISKAGNSSSNKEWALYTGGGGDRRLGLLIHDNSGSFYWVCTSSVVTAYENQWIHVLATYDGSESSSGINIYINGVVQSTTVVSGGTYGGMVNTSSPVTVGSYGGSTSFGDFQLASGGIWSAELDADAAAFLAANADHDLNTDSGNYDYSANIVAAHAIETGFGPFVIDSSGNGHHANSPSGAAPTWTTDVPS